MVTPVVMKPVSSSLTIVAEMRKHLRQHGDGARSYRFGT
jgi:hypothetical protein